ncbi:MAG: V-type ATP synthase subunit F [Brevinema sp.]
MSEHKKIAVIGNADTVLPFRSIGAESFEVETPDQLLQTVRQIAEQGTFGIIFIEETLAEPVFDIISKINDQYRGVAITSIPGTTGDGGVALKHLSAQVTRAIGIDIFAQKGGM